MTGPPRPAVPAGQPDTHDQGAVNRRTRTKTPCTNSAGVNPGATPARLAVARPTSGQRRQAALAGAAWCHLSRIGSGADAGRAWRQNPMHQFPGAQIPSPPRRGSRLRSRRRADAAQPGLPNSVARNNPVPGDAGRRRRPRPARLAARPHAPIRRSSVAARRSVPRGKRPVHPEAHHHDPDARPRPPRGNGAIRGTAGKTQRRCSRDARKTRGWALVLHAASRQTSHNRTKGAAPMRLPPPDPGVLRASLLHLRETLLALPHAARCRQNPMHQFGRAPAGVPHDAPPSLSAKRDARETTRPPPVPTEFPCCGALSLPWEDETVARRRHVRLGRRQ
jgi:hypothetical protein